MGPREGHNLLHKHLRSRHQSHQEEAREVHGILPEDPAEVHSHHSHHQEGLVAVHIPRLEVPEEGRTRHIHCREGLEEGRSRHQVDQGAADSFRDNHDFVGDDGDGGDSA